jgi:RNA polymerase sigma-70 factor (ECF subfamily)
MLEFRSMKALAADNLTDLLRECRGGDKAALDRLMPIVYDELRRIAHRYVQHERDGHTLQTSALVNEAYLRFAVQRKMDWQNRAHFFAVTAQVMRHILIDHARRRRYAKHGGDVRQIPIDDAAEMSLQRAGELIALEEALDQLAKLDRRKSQVVELRYFGGFSLEETAQVLDISLMTVRRDWRAAKAWLYRSMKNDA